MKFVARYLLIAILVSIVGAALVFVWAMQQEIDISAPEARAKYDEAMTLGCKLRLPEALKAANMSVQLSPEQAAAVCGCAVDAIIDRYAVAGKLRPSDVSEEQIDTAELACLKQQTAQ